MISDVIKKLLALRRRRKRTRTKRRLLVKSKVEQEKMWRRN